MVVGIGTVELLIAETRSLKEKRGVLSRILKRTQNEFNVSIAEVGNQDLWGRAIIGFSVVGNDTSYINSKMDKMLRFIGDLMLAEVIHTHIEIINLSDAIRYHDYEERKYDPV